MSHGAFPPDCPPSWCETGSYSSPLASQYNPSVEERPYSHLYRPKTKEGEETWCLHALLNWARYDIWGDTIKLQTCNLSQSSLSPLKSNSSLLSTVEKKTFIFIRNCYFLQFINHMHLVNIHLFIFLCSFIFKSIKWAEAEHSRGLHSSLI